MRQWQEKNSILANWGKLRGTPALGGQLSDLNIEDSHAGPMQSQWSFIPISGHAIIPKYYYVPADFVEAEQSKHGSQKRFPSNSGRDGKIFLWGQALYNLAKLLGMTCICSVYAPYRDDAPLWKIKQSSQHTVHSLILQKFIFDDILFWYV